MARAGREPAEDVKRRIVHACEAAGLCVSTARMYLRKPRRERLILVAASPEDWPHAHPLVSVFTIVKLNGIWSGEVDIRCSTAEQDPVLSFWDTFVMRGRDAVPLEDLVQHLRLTLEEREQVMAAVKLGVTGPYEFGQTQWEVPKVVL